MDDSSSLLQQNFLLDSRDSIQQKLLFKSQNQTLNEKDQLNQKTETINNISSINVSYLLDDNNIENDKNRNIFKDNISSFQCQKQNNNDSDKNLLRNLKMYDTNQSEYQDEMPLKQNNMLLNSFQDLNNTQKKNNKIYEKHQFFSEQKQKRKHFVKLFIDSSEEEQFYKQNPQDNSSEDFIFNQKQQENSLKLQQNSSENEYKIKYVIAQNTIKDAQKKIIELQQKLQNFNQIQQENANLNQENEQLKTLNKNLITMNQNNKEKSQQSKRKSMEIRTTPTKKRDDEEENIIIQQISQKKQISQSFYSPKDTSTLTTQILKQLLEEQLNRENIFENCLDMTQKKFENLSDKFTQITIQINENIQEKFLSYEEQISELTQKLQNISKLYTQSQNIIEIYKEDFKEQQNLLSIYQKLFQQKTQFDSISIKDFEKLKKIYTKYLDKLNSKAQMQNLSLQNQCLSQQTLIQQLEQLVSIQDKKLNMLKIKTLKKQRSKSMNHNTHTNIPISDILNQKNINNNNINTPNNNHNNNDDIEIKIEKKYGEKIQEMNTVLSYIIEIVKGYDFKLSGYRRITSSLFSQKRSLGIKHIKVNQNLQQNIQEIVKNNVGIGKFFKEFHKICDVKTQCISNLRNSLYLIISQQQQNNLTNKQNQSYLQNLLVNSYKNLILDDTGVFDLRSNEQLLQQYINQFLDQNKQVSTSRQLGKQQTLFYNPKQVCRTSNE